MRGKQGFMFGFILVFVTLFLSLAVLLLYGVQQRNSDNSLVSPSSVLEMRDDLTLFEMKEVELIKESWKSTKLSFDDAAFKETFRGIFVDNVYDDKFMTNFIFEGLFYDGNKVRDEDKDKTLFGDLIYPARLVQFEGDKLVLGRTKVEKRSLLVATDQSKIEFPVYFTFEFGQKYLIDAEGNAVKV